MQTVFSRLNSEFERSSSLPPLLVDADKKKLVIVPGLPKTFAGAVNVRPKVCAVCGDKATGYHYDAPSCNGCKSFFKRTVLQGRSYECKNDKQCALLKEKRRLCRACRFGRCLAAGMNPLLVQISSDDRKNLKNLTKSLKRNAKSTVSPVEVSVVEYETLKSISDLLKTESKLHFLWTSSLCMETEEVTLAELLRSSNLIDDVSRYQAVKDWAAERSHLNKATSIDRIKAKRPVKYKEWLFCNTILSVEFAKTFSFFAELSLRDKARCWVLEKTITLVRGTSAIECMLFVSFNSLKKNVDTHIFPDGTMTVWLNPPRLLRYVIAKNMEILIRSQLDDTEYALLRVLALANDALECLSMEARTKLRRKKEKYAKLLFDYLMKKYDTAEGLQKFTSLLGAINSYIELAAKGKEFQLLASAVKDPVYSTHHFKLIDEIVES
ncbi:unnamed protein product [Enterobius vermicularis]|uniref:Nuclear receptor n=1 Tax=Enterobius vermicularis TaxID=51028 RepID=A0A0N4V7Y2_ENTVE|nr:unnamed protein product [Enterobius vermicularis]